MNTDAKKPAIFFSGLLFFLLLGEMMGCSSFFQRKPSLSGDGLAGEIHDSGPPKDEDPESPAIMPLRLYQTYMSGVDGHRCPMTPSCSSYAIAAFRKFGFIRGWVMTCDRLLRCGRDETRLSQHIFIEGQKRTYDPVENNEFR